MPRSGQISVLISKELQALITVARGLDREVAKQNRVHTKRAAEPIWAEETRGRAKTRLQTRVLSDTARVAVSDTNVTLKSGVVGKLRSGTAVSTLASAVEQGVGAEKQISTSSRTGTKYKRRMGNTFGGARTKGGNVFGPAFRSAVSRVASLWMQTTMRTVAEEFEKGAR